MNLKYQTIITVIIVKTLTTIIPDNEQQQAIGQLQFDQISTQMNTQLSQVLSLQQQNYQKREQRGILQQIPQLDFYQNQGCRIWHWNKQFCVECLDNWFLSDSGICQYNYSSLDKCTQFNDLGQCIQCQQGHILINNICLYKQRKKLGCSQWNQQTNKCMGCEQNWMLNYDEKCNPVINLCRLYNQYGQCVQCMEGFYLQSELCVPQNQIIQQQMFCKIWNLQNQSCIQCLPQWYLNQEGVCIQYQ